jgi:hypothetical protein
LSASLRFGSVCSGIEAGRGTTVRTEVLWINEACDAALHRSRGGLFAGLEAAA